MAAPNAGQEKRTLYVGNLAYEATEQVLWSVFSQWGQITSCKVIRDLSASATPFAFIEYSLHQQAQMALSAMNHITLMGREMRVNWATSPGQGPRSDKGSHVFVGDLLPELSDDELNDAFAPFGPMFECKVIRNSDGASRGYAFITFENEPDATEAISRLHGTLLCGKTCKVNWATKKPPCASDFGGRHRHQDAPRYNSYEEAYGDASLHNTTVYLGGLQDALTEEFIKAHFIEFGQILNMSIFPDKGFAFIRYETHEAAARAIFGRNFCTIDGYGVRCSWGREQNQHHHHLQQQQQQQQLAPRPGGGAGDPFSMVPPSEDSGGTATNQEYEQYCNQYMEWYNKYGQQYYEQYCQQNGSDNGGGGGGVVGNESGSLAAEQS